MNNTIKALLRLLPVTIIGLLINNAILAPSSGGIEAFIESIIMCFFFVGFAVALLVTFLKDRKVYRQTHLKLSFIPAVTGMIFITSFLVTNVVATARDRSPVLIHASYVEDFYGSGFEFREDGTYKFTEIHGLVGVTFSRGKYVLKDSLITLDRSNIDDIIKSRFLIIRKRETYDTAQLIMYQINDQHHILEGSTKYMINIDKRK
jgi:hypothetical protein